MGFENIMGVRTPVDESIKETITNRTNKWSISCSNTFLF